MRGNSINRRTSVCELKWMALYQFALFCGVIILFHPILNHDFVLWDDDINIFGVSLYQRPDALMGIWFSFEMPSYLPVTQTLWYVEKILFGTSSESARYFHAISLILHAANTILVFHLALKFKIGKASAFLFAALFAVHPWRVENVAWATEQKSLLGGLFLWISWLFYMSFSSSKRSNFFYLSSLFFFALSLLSKPTAVFFPIVLVLMETMLKKKHIFEMLKQTLPFFVASFGMGVITMARETWGGRTLTGGDYSSVERVTIALRNVWDYLIRFAFPSDLSIFRRWDTSLNLFANWFSVGLFLSILFFSLYLASKGRGRFYLWCFLGYLLFLLPISGLFRMPYNYFSFTADRYMYLPLFFPLLAMTKALSGRQKSLPPTIGSFGVVAILPAFLIGLWSFKTYEGVHLWETSIAFWRHNAYNSKPPHPVAFNNLGVALNVEGELEQAREAYEKSLTLAPKHIQALNNLGSVLMELGRGEEAVQRLETSLKIDSNNAETHDYYGQILVKQKKFEEARSHFLRAVKINSGNAEYCNNLGSAYLSTGKHRKSLPLFQRALSIRPEYADAHHNLGLAFARLGENDSAGVSYARAVNLNPDEPEYFYNYGNLLLKTGEIYKAIDQFKRSLVLSPGTAKVHNNLGIALAREGSDEEARGHFLKALEINPDYEQAMENLAILED